MTSTSKPETGDQRRSPANIRQLQFGALSSIAHEPTPNQTEKEPAHG